MEYGSMYIHFCLDYKIQGIALLSIGLLAAWWLIGYWWCRITITCLISSKFTFVKVCALARVNNKVSKPQNAKYLVNSSNIASASSIQYFTSRVDGLTKSCASAEPNFLLRVKTTLFTKIHLSRGHPFVTACYAI